MQHQRQSSPGWKDWTIGWFVAWKCLVACLFLEESQQPTCPHSRQRRRCTHVSPIFKQSSQPFALGVTCRIWLRCVHRLANECSFLEEFGTETSATLLSSHSVVSFP